MESMHRIVSLFNLSHLSNAILLGQENRITGINKSSIAQRARNILTIRCRYCSIDSIYSSLLVSEVGSIIFSSRVHRNHP